LTLSPGNARMSSMRPAAREVIWAYLLALNWMSPTTLIFRATGLNRTGSTLMPAVFKDSAVRVMMFGRAAWLESVSARPVPEFLQA
jgi:hypothetical protein